MRNSFYSAVFLLVIFSGQATGQQANEAPGALPQAARPAPPTLPVGSFAAGRKNTLEFRTQDEMTEVDRQLLANAEGTIEERARFNNFMWNEEPWSLQQAVCPALPRHILVQFTRQGGKGDESVFTVAIPRNPDGRIRLVPVERRGYSLWSPAPVNQITINTFNKIRAEEDPNAPVDWLTLGMCYASMTGARPRADLLAKNQQSEEWALGQPATLVLEKDGTKRIEFVDRAALPREMHWVMFFDKHGRLLKATHKPAELLSTRPVKPIVEVTPRSAPRN